MRHETTKPYPKSVARTKAALFALGLASASTGIEAAANGEGQPGAEGMPVMLAMVAQDVGKGSETGWTLAGPADEAFRPGSIDPTRSPEVEVVATPDMAATFRLTAFALLLALPLMILAGYNSRKRRR
ncbi:MAG: hypothetical protein V2J02_10850 [Pseudomonadales bacterium]|jgi:hypothetical protein|nr:hypothetical protein [Pseudomonadales bacterium]